MKQFLRNSIFFIGWILSPLTFWNDAFVNIPLSYALANLFKGLLNVDFVWLVLVSYWITNALGLCLMYAAGKDIVRSRGGIIKAISSLVITTLVYSMVIFVLARIGILKPL